jgi:hypothetical protein
VSTGFPFIEVPKRLLGYLGKKEKGTREYTAVGDAEVFRQWVNALLAEEDLPVVTFTWATLYVGVSREAVYKRCREGRLTLFGFYVDKSIPFFGRVKFVRASYGFLSLKELQAWREELQARKGQRAGG